jgi:hypothetical protein
MSDRNNANLASLLTPATPKGAQVTQGKILSWDREELHNQVEWRGITLTDVPLIEGVNALSLKVGDIVVMVGWAPENAKGVGTWFILGKVSVPGEFIADLTFFLGQIRFQSKTGEDQAYFGSDTDGEPLTDLYYGDSSSTPAIRIANRDSIAIRDPSGNIIFSNDAATDVGLARPYLHYSMVPTVNAVISGTVFVPSTVAAAYVSIYEGTPTVWHPRVTYDIRINSTGTPGWRLLANGTVVFTGTTSASGSFNIPGWGTTVMPDDVVTFTLEARNTGAGLTRVMVCRFEGTQT